MFLFMALHSTCDLSNKSPFIQNTFLTLCRPPAPAWVKHGCLQGPNAAPATMYFFSSQNLAWPSHNEQVLRTCSVMISDIVDDKLCVCSLGSDTSKLGPVADLPHSLFWYDQWTLRMVFAFLQDFLKLRSPKQRMRPMKTLCGLLSNWKYLLSCC